MYVCVCVYVCVPLWVYVSEHARLCIVCAHVCMSWSAWNIKRVHKLPVNSTNCVL